MYLMQLKMCFDVGGKAVADLGFLEGGFTRLLVDHRCRGLGAQPLAAEEVLIFKSIQSIEFYTLDHYQS